MTLKAITTQAYDVELDISYATARNFTGAPVYRQGLCYLHEDAERCLQNAIKLASALGYRFRIFDGFRPHEAQWKLWEHTPDPQFLSHPETGSLPHCRGVAVDLTLIDASGTPLDMGTPFDSFTPRSHHGRTDIPTEAQTNRFILLGIMTAAGWDFYRNEWWHYQLFNPRQYPIVSDKEADTGMM